MNPTIRIAIIGILWVIFVLYWLIPAARFQRTVRTNAWRYVGLIGLIRSPGDQAGFAVAGPDTVGEPHHGVEAELAGNPRIVIERGVIG